jgi:1-acyl-sn-glycerol-3-phosphate acyltransferase
MKALWIFLQIITVPAILIVRIIFRIRVVFENDIQPEKGCLMISTHEGKFDPFYVLNFYGFWKSIWNVPYRFPVIHEYMIKKILKYIITAFGGYDIGDTIEEKAKMLFYTRKVLENKGSIVIFPEGRLVKGGHDFIHFQKGYTFLITEGTQVILVKMYNMHHLLKTFFSKKRPSITYRTIPSSASHDEVLQIIESFYSHGL